MTSGAQKRSFSAPEIFRSVFLLRFLAFTISHKVFIIIDIREKSGGKW